MIYLSSFNLVSDRSEFSFLSNPYLPTYHLTVYPFRVFPDKGLQLMSFSDITIFSGGNGSGKSTLLNIIAEKLCLKRDSLFNKSSLFDNYVEQTEKMGSNTSLKQSNREDYTFWTSRRTICQRNSN